MTIINFRFAMTIALLIFLMMFPFQMVACQADDQGDTMTALIGTVIQSFAGNDGGYGGTQDPESDDQLDYYINPQREGYYQAVWGAVCPRCGQNFAVSAAEVNENRFTRCPNCGAMLNPAQAHKDYLALQQEAEQGRSYSWRIGGNGDD